MEKIKEEVKEKIKSFIDKRFAGENYELKWFMDGEGMDGEGIVVTYKSIRSALCSNIVVACHFMGETYLDLHFDADGDLTGGLRTIGMVGNDDEGYERDTREYYEVVDLIKRLELVDIVEINYDI